MVHFNEDKNMDRCLTRFINDIANGVDSKRDEGFQRNLARRYRGMKGIYMIMEHLTYQISELSQENLVGKTLLNYDNTVSLIDILQDIIIPYSIGTVSNKYFEGYGIYKYKDISDTRLERISALTGIVKSVLRQAEYITFSSDPERLDQFNAEFLVYFRLEGVRRSIRQSAWYIHEDFEMSEDFDLKEFIKLKGVEFCEDTTLA